MKFSIKRYVNLLKFIYRYKSSLKQESEENLDKLIEIAIEERGILYKLIQSVFPEKIPQEINLVKSTSKEQIILIIENELGIVFKEHFKNISEPLFCASIGQVHKLELKHGKYAGKSMAIKIQYPEVKQSIKSQLNILKMAAKSANFSPIARWKIDTVKHIDKISSRLNEELDYRNEMKNLIRFSENNSHNNQLNYSFIQYSNSQILSQLWIDGVDLKFVIQNWDNDKKKIVAQLLVENYLKQIFKDGFFQGDTNTSNFLFSNIEENIEVHWIDFGNWCSISDTVQKSLYLLIFQKIKDDDINYLGNFENLGFDLKKINYFQNVLPNLITILFEPFLINQPYNLNTWNLDEQINNLLGENKWWFRSSGDSSFLELIKSFSGIVKIIKELKVNINWQKIFIMQTKHLDTIQIIQSIPVYQNDIPQNKQLAKTLRIVILKNGNEHAHIELPATSLLDIENLVSQEVKDKLKEQQLNLAEIKFNYLKNGLIPGEVFNLEINDNNLSNENMKYHVYLV